MRSDNILIIIISVIVFTSKALAADVPFLNEARSNVVRPSVFILEDREGASAPLSDWIKIATKQYYIEACDLLKKEIADRATKGMAADQVTRTLSSYESDAKNKLLPRWVENVFIICKESEVTVSFFARNGGWAEMSTGGLASSYNTAYIITIDSKSGEILNLKNKLKAAVYVNLYKSLADEGIATDYSQKAGFVTPLNPSKQNGEP